MELVRRSLHEHGTEAVAAITVENWLCRIRVFGFHMARLDIRQESKYYEQVVAELLARQNLCLNYMACRKPNARRYCAEPWGRRNLFPPTCSLISPWKPWPCFACLSVRPNSTVGRCWEAM